MQKRIRLTINGRVQGVGFRPTVYRYAVASGLSGYVKNAPFGVLIEVEGEEESISKFIDLLKKNPPKQAKIEKIEEEYLTPAGEKEFHILQSHGSGDLLVGMPPDIATCEQCLSELFDPGNRRFGYPFINCTNCGPRFTIIRELPYDREKTSMNSFKLCNECNREYLDPESRRFDAQPNACEKCGPSLKLIQANGEKVPGDPIKETAKLLKKGSIITLKGLGGYHLCCDALNEDAVSLLRKRKRRPAKALAVMFSSIDEIEDHCIVSESEEKELILFRRPIVILHRKTSSSLSGLIAPNTTTIGAFLPYTPMHHLLLTEISPLIMTSGNLAEEPIVKDEDELKRIFGNIADYALIHNRPVIRRCDDSVVKLVNDKCLFLRRSRGFVPDCIELPFKGPSVLACGAELKNTFCITRGSQAFMSQHIGDLTEYRAYSFFRESIEDLISLLEIKPEILAFDMHPDYPSTRYAKETPCDTKVEIQHHHAHIASCMIENNISEPVIGVALDGTGLGTDGTVWGGEFLVTDLIEYERAAHFKQYPMPGGDKAVQNPIRMALSYCITEQGDSMDPFCNSMFEKFFGKELDIIIRMIKQRFHSPITSSCGRLFDAVAALLGISPTISYEGQAAINLQYLAHEGVTSGYSFEINVSIDNMKEISFGPTIQEIINDLKKNKDTGLISAMFHNTVATAVTEMCKRIYSCENISKVVLSGGVFQNDLLLELIVKRLHKEGLDVYYHNIVPPNDAGVALGQAGIALARYHNRIITSNSSF